MVAASSLVESITGLLPNSSTDKQAISNDGLSAEHKVLQATLRSQFPFLEKSDWVFVENAGGSAAPSCVINAISEYMRTSYVQLGAGYPAANRADAAVAAAHNFLKLWMNAGDKGEVVLGDSSSRLMQMIADSYADEVSGQHNIIISEAAHEANCGPWTRLAKRKRVELRVWPVNSDGTQSIQALLPLIDTNTRAVAFVHCSNLAGTIIDVAAVSKAVHEKTDNQAIVVVDGVAYAPHRCIDVQAWDVDFYGFSTYKTWGPHMAAMYGKHNRLSQLMKNDTAPINHYFVPQSAPYKLELGCLNHEGCAGIAAIQQYLAVVLGRVGDAALQQLTRNDIVAAFDLITLLEEPITKRMIDYLVSKPGVKLVGSSSIDSAIRVPTISFVHISKSAVEVVAALHAHKIAARTGHCYAHRMCTALGISLDAGVVRISGLHYTTEEEAGRIFAALETVL